MVLRYIVDKKQESRRATGGFLEKQIILLYCIVDTVSEWFQHGGGTSVQGFSEALRISVNGQPRVIETLGFNLVS
jgi:hypothetical protein